MRIPLFFGCFLLMASLHAQSTSDKLEAYFSFDNNCQAVDDSGNGSSGASVNGLGCTCGIGDSSLLFDGVDDALYLVGPFNDVFTTSDFTVSFYIKVPDNIGNGTRIVMSKQAACNTNNVFWVRYTKNNGIQSISSSISENDNLIATVQAKLDDGPCWQFVTLTRSNTRYTLYINGTARDTKTSAARLNLTSTTTFKIGEPICPLDRPFLGQIDELRFHSKALSEDDVLRYDQRADKILNSDTLIYLGNSFQASVSAPCANQFAWIPTTGVSDPNAPNPVITPVLPGFYTVQMQYDDPVCLAFDTVYVNVIDPDTLDCANIFIPNAFTPSASSGRNDEFGISNPFSVDEFISFEIFDRWGGRVFNGDNAQATWDGTSNGQPVNPGVFLYRLRYKCDGKEKVKAGSLTLLR